MSLNAVNVHVYFMSKSPRLIAFYLPQYHPIPENDAWWGKGFTEWTNTAKAQPLFPGHYQPHVPADLGFYDLRLAESRVAQAEMAKQYGLEGFCYYHYWFGGKKLLERPLEEVLQSGKPDFGFCMCWANQTWTGVWHGAPGRILIEQTYPGDEDHRNHFEYLLPAFQDERHIRVDGKPVFVIYSPMEIPDVKRTMDLWREMAVAAGLKGLHLVAAVSSDWVPQEHGFDASITSRLPKLRGSVSAGSPVKWLLNQYRKKRGWPSIYSYEKILSVLLDKEKQGIENYNCVIPNWDNTPRSGENGLVFQGSTPELFRRHFREALEISQALPDDRRFIFIKSWNEWAEGNHLEPDLKYGLAYLNVIDEELKEDAVRSTQKQ